MSTNKPSVPLHSNRFTLRHDTGNGLVGIPGAGNLTETQIQDRIREMRRAGDLRNFAITDSRGNVVAHVGMILSRRSPFLRRLLRFRWTDGRVMLAICLTNTEQIATAR